MTETKEIITADFILETLQGFIENKSPIAPSAWVDAASKLNVLLGQEHDKLADLKSEVANIKLTYLQEDPKRNVSAAKMKTESEPKYTEMMKQEMKVSRIEEFIRIAKLRGRLSEGEFKGY